MSRRQQLAFALQRWELRRAGAAYLARMVVAQRVMPTDLRLLTLQLWAEFQTMKLDHLQRIARQIEAEDEPEVIEVPVEYLARYL